MTPAAFNVKKSGYETTWRWWVLGTLFLATVPNGHDLFSRSVPLS